MKRIIFLFIALMLCGCGKTQYKSVQDTLAELKNYSANADVTYFSNKGELIRLKNTRVVVFYMTAI